MRTAVNAGRKVCRLREVEQLSPDAHNRSNYRGKHESRAVEESAFAKSKGRSRFRYGVKPDVSHRFRFAHAQG